MTLVVDASAIVAMIAREPEAWHFSRRMDWETDRLTSAVALWEAVRAVVRVRGVDLAEARTLVADFVRDAQLRVVPIASEEADLALDAHQRFERGMHPAALNMGDCFSYACTRRHDAIILFKGQDFAQTDLKDAMLE